MNDFERVIELFEEIGVSFERQEGKNYKFIDFIDSNLNKSCFNFDRSGKFDNNAEE